MKTAQEISVLDEAIRAIRARMDAKLADPKVRANTSYFLGVRHAADLAVMELENIRDAW